MLYLFSEHLLTWFLITSLCLLSLIPRFQVENDAKVSAGNLEWSVISDRRWWWPRETETCVFQIVAIAHAFFYFLYCSVRCNIFLHFSESCCLEYRPKWEIVYCLLNIALPKLNISLNFLFGFPILMRRAMRKVNTHFPCVIPFYSWLPTQT